MIKASCPPGGVVLDPFMGSGTTAVAARGLGRQYVGFELNPEYCEIIQARLAAPEVPVAGAKKRKASARKKATPALIVDSETVVPAEAGTHAELATHIQHGFPPSRE
jgi:site-specific DNA-methyltransferase (adenine-specific)